MPPDNRTKRIAILQPGYIPWLGFFEQMQTCEVFVFLDDVQFTKNDWRNRNRIKTKEGIQWLTVPVHHKFGQKIKDVLIDNASLWTKKHLQSLKSWYGKSRFFKEIAAELENMYAVDRKYLVDVDIEMSLWIKNTLGITCDILRSSELSLRNDDKQMRLIEICKTADCNFFYEGKSGQNYIDVNLFKDNGITVEFQDYQHPYYNQLWMKEQGFISHLSIIDLLFNHGPNSLAILTGQKVIEKPKGVVLMRNANEIQEI